MSELAKLNESDGVRGQVTALRDGNVALYSSILADTFEGKKQTLNAITNSVAIADHLGATINLANIVVQVVEMVDEKSGEMTDQPRVILVDADGTAYHAISSGILKSVENTIGMLGEPSTWPEPVPIQVAEERGRNGFRYYTIKFL